MALCRITRAVRYIMKGEKGDPGKDGTDGQDGKQGEKGETGARGPATRGPQKWEDLEEGYQLMSGETGEDFVDMIIDSNGLYFMCIKSHEKSSQIIPTNASYFRAAQKIEVVAAYAVLARTIIMTDADNNVVFRAENGDVECTQGNFKNVKVEGAITASTLDLKSDESAMIVSPGDTVTLPALEEGYARRVLIIINRMMRNTNYPITVKGADGVFIDKPKWYADSSVAAVYHTSQQYASDGGCDYEAVGFNYKGSTYWAIYKLSDAESAVS